MNVLMIDTEHRMYWDDVPNTLEALQTAVGGNIEVVPMDTHLCVICNEEGELLGLPPVAAMPARRDVLCGPLVICRTTPDGVVLCLTCEKDLERVPDESIRLGYYARHPEALAELLIQANSGYDLGLSVCQSDCADDLDTDVDCTDEKFATCIVRWLLESYDEEVKKK